jgi:phosphoribosylanthranilate isomerase
LMANSELPKLLKKQGFCKRIDWLLSKNKKIIYKQQLHGKRICRFCLNLKSEFDNNNIWNRNHIKVFSIADDFDFELLKALWK